MKDALEGVKIADFTWAAAGPITTKLLADFGATVVKIESTKVLDTIRTFPPFKGGKPAPDLSYIFSYISPNKYSMALDLSHPKGIEVAKRLIAWADVVCENFSAGVMEKMGLGYEELRKIKPDIIMYRATNLGQTGPLAGKPGYGFQLVGLAGFIHATGWPDRDPTQPATALTDIIAPPFGAAAILAALEHRRRTGAGQCLDASQHEAALQTIAPAMLDYALTGRVVSRQGNSDFCGAPHGAYRCRGDDRWCAIAVFGDEEWGRFCDCIGNPKWTKEPRFATLLDRKSNEEELDKLIESWTLGFTAEEVMNLMQTNGVKAAVVQNMKDLTEDRALKERDRFWQLEHRELGPMTHWGAQIGLSKTPARPRMPAPCLGEHTELVCREFLKLSDEEFIELFNADVFQ